VSIRSHQIASACITPDQLKFASSSRHTTLAEQGAPRLVTASNGPSYSLRSPATRSRGTHSESDVLAGCLVLRASHGVPVGFLQPLILDVRARHTLSIVLEPLGHRKAARVVESQASTSEAQQLMDQKIGRRQKRAQLREACDLARREEDPVEGHAVYRLAAFVSLTARSLPELEHLSPQIESAMNSASMEGTRWYTETDQAFIAAALPFATGLN
jgi:hypothetical protein